jgi:hypothetical protein
MRTKHTNGQWTAEKINKNYMILSDRMYIGSVSSSDVGNEQAEANAKLIASAPDMLKFIQWVSEQVVNTADISKDALLGLIKIKADKIIDKATK